MPGSGERFADRHAAGKMLASAVRKLEVDSSTIVLALPRGGVPVAYEIARAMRLPLDVMVVRKIGMPGQPELAIGAIAPWGVVVREPGNYQSVGESTQFERLARRELVELGRREEAYRKGLPALDLAGKTVMLVDDGIATGATMVAAIRAARHANARKVIVAAPVASDDAAAVVAGEADLVVIPNIPAFFGAVGSWYGNFEPVEDAEVRKLLEQASVEARGDPNRALRHRGPA